MKSMVDVARNTARYSNELNNKRNLIEQIKTPLQRCWADQYPDLPIYTFIYRIKLDYDIDITVNRANMLENVIINNPKKYTMFLLKYG